MAEVETGAPKRDRSRIIGWSINAGTLLFLVWLVVFDLRVPFLQNRPVDRSVYLKMPVENVQFHWCFDRPALLEGRLTLRIDRDDDQQEVVVFDNGAISPGWREIASSRCTDQNQIYFGFVSDRLYSTASDDLLEIELTVPTDVPGQGRWLTGSLPAGVHRSTGSYSNIYGGMYSPIDLVVLRASGPRAFLQCWRNPWSLNISEERGWAGVRPEPDTRDRVFGLLAGLVPNRGTDGGRCDTT